jgi:hypothetical protein
MMEIALAHSHDVTDPLLSEAITALLAGILNRKDLQ